MDLDKVVYTGNEFKEGDKAKLDWGGGLITEVEVRRWTKEYGGWWYVRLSNGGMHYTRRLIKE